MLLFILLPPPLLYTVVIYLGFFFFFLFSIFVEQSTQRKLCTRARSAARTREDEGWTARLLRAALPLQPMFDRALLYTPD